MTGPEPSGGQVGRLRHPEVAVRAVLAEQWQEWRDLRLAALAEAPYAFEATLEDWRDADEDRWRERLLSVPLNLIAIVKQQAVGMVSSAVPAAPERPGGEVELISLWVAPAGRGCGVGDALIQAAVGWARDQSADRVVLAVREGNRHAISLYERNGFRDIGRASAPTDSPPERRMVLAWPGRLTP